MKIIMTRGLQASGKTTWSKNFISENQNYKRVSRDDLRHMLSNYTFDNENEKIVSVFEDKIIEDLIKNDFNIIIDKMNLNEKQFEKDINTIKSFCILHNKEYEIEVKEFPITLPEALKRDRERPFSLGESVIKRTWEKYEIELKQLNERNRPKLERNEGLPKCILVDVDGTLSHSFRRRIYTSSVEEILSDKLIEQVKFVVNSIAKNKECKIIIFSGRKKMFEETTTKWLKDNDVYFDSIFLRNDDDNRSDVVVKKEMFDNYIKDKYNCLFVFDDRPKVLMMWQEMGLFTFNVNQDVYAKNDF